MSWVSDIVEELPYIVGRKGDFGSTDDRRVKGPRAMVLTLKNANG
jgi:hypothetical protein